MLERLISLSLRQRGPVLLGVVALAVFGIWALLNLPVDAFPDVTNVQVEVVSTAPGLSPLEIEKFVTAPIEMAMRGLPRLVQMRSLTKFGIAVVTLVFEDGVDIYFARQLVFQRLAEVERRLPAGVETEMGPVATAMGEIYHYVLEGQEPGNESDRVRTLTEWRTLQDWLVAPLLKGVPGVSEVNSFGGYLKQYQAWVEPDRLRQFGLSVGDVCVALEKNNENVGGSVVDRYAEQFIVRGIGLLRDEEDIGRIVLKSAAGVPVLLRDVASVRVGQTLRQGAALQDGKREVVGGVVMMLRGENSLQVVRRIAARVEDINGSGVLPAGMRIRPYYQRSAIIETSVTTVIEALAEGALLVLFILFLFLRSVRGALVVLLALPLSLLLTFVVMQRVGLDANLMSLGGLAISIGMIIDATIIQVENVQRRLAERRAGEAHGTTVLGAVLEVRKPSIFGELIIALTFIPILTLQGMEGKMFTPLALTVAVALLASLLLSVFVIPVFCSLFLASGPQRESLLLRGAKRLYLPALAWSLRHKRTVLGLALLLLAGALWLLPRLGTEFIPVMDEGAFDMDIQLLPGISLDKALEVNRTIQQRLMEFPEMETVVSRTGQSGIALEAKGVDKTGYTGSFRPRSQWPSRLTKEQLVNRLRDSLADIPGMTFGFSQPIQCRIDELVAGTRAQLILKLFGDDTEVLKTKASEAATILSGIPGTVDLMSEPLAGQPYISVRANRAAIATYGLSVAGVLAVFQTAVAGKVATRIYEGNRFFDCLVRFPEEKRNSPESIGNILVTSPRGQLIPLSQLADIGLEEGPVQISREDGQRRIGIEFNVRGRDIGGYVRQAGRQAAPTAPPAQRLLFFLGRAV